MTRNAHVPGRPWVLALLLACFVVLSLLYNATTPIFEAPDELQHVAYVVELTDTGTLPVVSSPPADPGPWEQEGTQPPLYYWLAARLAGGVSHDAADDLARLNPYAGVGDPQRPDNKNRVLHDLEVERWPYRGTALLVHLVRGLSTLMAVGTLVAIYGLGRTVFPERPGIALGMAGLVAFIPQFLFLSAAVNNDNLVILIASWTLLLLATWVGRAQLPGWPSVGALGLLLGLAALAKLSGLLLWPLAGAVLAWLAWRERRFGWLIPAGLLVLGLALAISGWWFVRNQQLYGDLTGLAAHLEIMGTRRRIPTLIQAVRELKGFRYSFWALFGWFNILAPDLFYWVLDGLVVLGGVGFLTFIVRSKGNQRFPFLFKSSRPAPPLPGPARRDHDRRPALGMLGVWLLLVVAGVLRWTLMTRASQGRLLYPALPVIALILVAGWAELLHLSRSFRVSSGSGLAKRGQVAAGLAGPLALVVWAGWAVLCPFLLIQPAYALPERSSARDLAILRQQGGGTLAEVQVRFGDCCQLVGYVAPPVAVHPGERVPLQLVWQALEPAGEDYRLFVHAVTADGQIAGQIDTYHGRGMYPTGQWRPGEYLADTVYVPLSWRAEGPALLRFNLGLQGSTRLPATGPDGQALEVVLAGEAGLVPYEWPPAAPAGVPVDTLFEDKIRLAAVDLPPQGTFQPGEVLTVTLHWLALAPNGEDYVGFVHLVGPDGTDVSQDDHLPLDGSYPTRLWVEGAVLADPYRIKIPGDLDPGDYELRGGLYRPTPGTRLRATSQVTGERWRDDLVDLGTLVVSQKNP